jgi:hypothetical protein
MAGFKTGQSRCLRRLGEIAKGLAMFTNRISSEIFDASTAPAASVSTPSIPAGFAVCQLAPVANPLAIQLIAQKQAYEKAILAAKEEALRIVLDMLKPSSN